MTRPTAPRSDDGCAALLARVRAALGRDTPPRLPDPPPPDDALLRLARPGDASAALFVERAREVGMEAETVEPALAAGRVVGVLREAGVRRVALHDDAEDHAPGLARELAAAGILAVERGGPAGPRALFDADAGVTGVLAGVAESGTLVCVSGPGLSRGASLVPPLHVALVRESRIVPDLLDLWPLVRRSPGAAAASSLTLITGPSKTADIEGVLVTGVHGPGRVRVLVVTGS